MRRFIHRRASVTSNVTRLVADGTVPRTLVLLLKGGTYLETGKHDSVGEVQMSYAPILAPWRGTGNVAVLSPPAQRPGFHPRG
jgi:hypothetical protein